MAQRSTYRIGDAELTRVVDLELRQFTPEKLYPKGWTGEPLAEPTAHLPEWSMDDVREHLLMSIHTWVIKDQGRVILVDTGAGNGKDRPFAPYFDHLDTRYLDRLTAAGPLNGSGCAAIWKYRWGRPAPAPSQGLGRPLLRGGPRNAPLESECGPGLP